eukprot:sb/3469320/
MLRRAESVGTSSKELDDGAASRDLGRGVVFQKDQLFFSCQLDNLYDKSIVTSVTYLFAGASSLSSSLPLPLDTNRVTLQEGQSDEYSLTAEEGTSPGVLQCLAKVGLADGSEAWVVSNSLLLDIHYSPTYADEIAKTTKSDILADKRKTKLECTMPASNPPTLPVWKFKAANSVQWIVLDLEEPGENMTPSRLARLAVDETDLKGDLYVNALTLVSKTPHTLFRSLSDLRARW